MQLSGHYRAARQPGNMSGSGMDGQRLIFLYPFAVDSSMGKYGMMCRDFFTVSFINEIKIDNALHIISSSSNKVGTIGTGNNRYNPAELVYKVTQYDPSNDKQQPQINMPVDPYFYQDRIDRVNMFLRNQLMRDPRFSSYRSVFSNITVGEFLDIPLIVGTKSYNIDSKYLCLLMMISIIFDIHWNDQGDINRANDILNRVINDPKTLTKLFIDENIRAEFTKELSINKNIDLNSPSAQTQLSNRMINYVRNNKQLSEIFFGLMYNQAKWEANTPEATHANLSFNSLSIDTRTQKRHFHKSISALTGYISQFIVPVLHSLDLLTGPTDPTTNVTEKINVFTDELVDGLSDKFINLSNNINNSLFKIAASDDLANASNVKSTTANIEQMKELCQENVSLGKLVEQLLDTLSRSNVVPVDFNVSDFSAFTANMARIGNGFKTHSKAVDDWLDFVSGDGSSQMQHLLRTISNSTQQLVHNLLYNRFPDSSGYGPWINREHLRPEYFYTVFSNFGSGLMQHHRFDVTNIDDRINNKKLIQDEIDQFQKSIAIIETSIIEMILFFIKWVFFSYMCDYLQDVEVDVEIQKRNALEFPNYCLVIPFTLFKTLYITQINKNFKSYLTSSKLTYDSFDHRSLTFNIGDIKGVFKIVTQQLKIPNLIVIDEKMKKCHYQFMYMTQPASINFATMESFIKHQQDVLPGF